LAVTDRRKQCGSRNKYSTEAGRLIVLPRREFSKVQERRGEGKMKRKLEWISAVSAVVLLVSTGSVRAQETREVRIQRGGVAEAQEGPSPVMIQRGVVGEGDAFFADRIELLGFGGMHGGKVVKGAPFSAVAVSMTTQTLMDGNHITRKTQTNLHRDSQGRIRKEVTLPAIGPLAASGHPHSFVEISDPVAGTSYVLEPDQKVARGMPGRTGMKVRTNGGPGGPGNVLYRTEGKAGTANAIAKTESLGTQTIDGMNVEGTRTTRTIPTGEIGNEQPITIVSERWYSADLQMVVKSTHSDPRFGDTTYTLTNIQRTEPAAALFAVPSDYAIEQGHREKFKVNVPPPPASPEN
jgi:hypothetical protein